MTLRSRWVLVAAAAILVVVLVAYFMGRDGGRKAKRQTLPKATPQLDTGGLALATLLKTARTQTYHVQYASTADKTVSGGTLSLEAWNTAGKSRVDTTLKTADGKVVHTASILVGKKAIGCQKPPAADWKCQTIATPADGDAAGLVASLTAKLSGRSVTEHADKVGGETARCFNISATASAEAIDACVNEHGVLLRVVSPDARLEMTKLDKSIPSDIFTPPAAAG